jgi:hypothetical protein
MRWVYPFSDFRINVNGDIIRRNCVESDGARYIARPICPNQPGSGAPKPGIPAVTSTLKSDSQPSQAYIGSDSTAKLYLLQEHFRIEMCRMIRSARFL